MFKSKLIKLQKEGYELPKGEKLYCDWCEKRLYPKKEAIIVDHAHDEDSFGTLCSCEACHVEVLSWPKYWSKGQCWIVVTPNQPNKYYEYIGRIGKSALCLEL
jgi:hypothetical protein